MFASLTEGTFLNLIKINLISVSLSLQQLPYKNERWEAQVGGGKQTRGRWEAAFATTATI